MKGINKANLKHLSFLLILAITVISCAHRTDQEKKGLTGTTGLLVPEDTPVALLAEISFTVKEGNDPADYIPFIGIENPKEEMAKLIDKDKKVINADTITVIIDYPLKRTYKFKLVSHNGFTRQTLIEEISKHYHLIYAEEEKTTTTKIIPIKERRGVLNRNETNGKHGIWGHDISDLMLSGILVYRTANGQIFLSLGIES